MGEEASPSDWEGRAGVCFPNPCGRLDDMEELVKIQIQAPRSNLDRVGLGSRPSDSDFTMLAQA